MADRGSNLASLTQFRPVVSEVWLPIASVPLNQAVRLRRRPERPGMETVEWTAIFFSQEAAWNGTDATHWSPIVTRAEKEDDLPPQQAKLLHYLRHAFPSGHFQQTAKTMGRMAEAMGWTHSVYAVHTLEQLRIKGFLVVRRDQTQSRTAKRWRLVK